MPHYTFAGLDGGPVNGDSSGSAALEIASNLVYAYRHNPIIQARKMVNPEHLALLEQGVETWNKWRHSNPGIEPNLRGANLEGADLSEANLRQANLRGANLEGADLSEANLRQANLRGANLEGADLSEANLRQANLRQVHLSEADLRGANLGGADLRKADLHKADLRGANLEGVDLRKADLRGANLEGVDLRRVDLRGTDLRRANLRGAYLPSVARSATGWDLDDSLRAILRPRKLTLLKSVLLGVSAPANVRPGEEFTVRFVAYLQEFEHQVNAILNNLSPRSKSYLGIEQCRWQEGVQVTVILSCLYLDIAEPRKEFEWHSPYQIISFDVIAQKTAPAVTVVLKLDVYIQDIRVASLRLDLQIHNAKFIELTKNLFKLFSILSSTYANRKIHKKITVRPAATTAFASYASQDRLRVLDRIDALKISAGIDVFQDCLSLKPSDLWKLRIFEEILNRDIFLLFWSKYAMVSQWVKWEWTTALKQRGEEVIQLHPLDTVEEAPPPPELATFILKVL